MANEVYCVTKEEGIADEACDVYRETTNPNADFVCADYQNRSWKNGDFNSYLLPTDAQFEDYLSSTVNKSNDIILWNGENGLKKTLISKGPISTGVKSWGHAMELVGYSVDPVDGGTVWIFKNSWGEAFANSGYVLLKLPISDLFEFAQPRGPFTIPTDANYLPAGFNNQVKCSDKDKDGFCSWGISNIGADDAWRQVNCPASCVENSQKDCDESSAYIRGSINGQTCEFAPTPKTIMTCRKLVNYTVAWQKTKCNASDCGDDNYVGCNKKRTALGVKKFQEV
jgi:hypothetical protein